MLQRAASNAYSWWWASHIRTKHTKWLEQNLQDMGEKVQDVLKLIEEDGDSFAKRAEMYYKKRPELINFVEESYRAYRALAERYDHISTELQNANNTIASVFPEQVQFMDEDDEHGPPRIPKKPSEVAKANLPNVPNAPTKNIESFLKSSAKKLRPKKATKTRNADVVRSGLSKTDALAEIDKLQKGILALQTEKEFVKVSYETGLAKYWDIEKQITEKHDKICKLQDEFGVGAVIEDDEARKLMASAALRSCQDTLTQLQDKQEKLAMEASVEQQKIKAAREKLKSLKVGLLGNEINQENPDQELKGKPNTTDQEVTGAAHAKELESLREKIKEQLLADGGNASLTVTGMAEKVDELVTTVVSLETALSSQTALISRLQEENEDLQAQIGSLENDRGTTVDGTNDLSSRLRMLEEKLHGVQDLNRSIEDENNNLQTHLTEAHCNLDHLNEKLDGMTPDEELPQEEDSTSGAKLQKPMLDDAVCAQANQDQQHPQKLDEETQLKDSSQEQERSLDMERKQFKQQEDRLNPGNESESIEDLKKEVGEEWKEGFPDASVKNQEDVTDQFQADEAVDRNQLPAQTDDESRNIKAEESGRYQDDEPNWQMLFSSGLENREKVLLEEYTTVLRNYKEAKRKCSEVEKKNEDSLFETAEQVKELRNANAMKDEEIQALRQKVKILETSREERRYPEDSAQANHHPTSKSDVQAAESAKPTSTGEDEDDVKVILMDRPYEISATEESFRMKIDELLEQNLDFWLRFSTSFHQIQKYQTGIEDLQAETAKLMAKLEEKNEGSHSRSLSLKSDARPIYKHLKEIQAELTVWVEQSGLLKDELQSRFSSLCNIQEQISKALKEGSEDEGEKLTGYQAAKFQGEVMNMQQENNKVADELQAGLDHITGLQFEVERAVAKLNEDFNLSGSKNQNHPQFQHSTSRSRVPLRSFIFGAKEKPQKQSILSCVHPMLHKKYNDLRSGIPMSLRSSSRKKD